MKTIIRIFFIVFLGTTTFAKDKAKPPGVREPASSWLKEMSPDSARILDVLSTSCPEKLAEAMQGANAVGKVYYGEKNGDRKSEWMWQITTVRRTPFPFMSERPVATLIIDWNSQPNDGPVAPDRGTEWDMKCSIQKVSP